MRYFYLLDQAVQKYFIFKYHPGQENLGDYPTKHHTAAIHQHVRLWYLHNKNSPRVLPQEMRPSSRRGCAGTLGDPYLRQVPLPRIPTSRDWQESAPAISAPAKRARAPAFMSPAKRAVPTKYPTDTFPTILSVEPERKRGAPARLNRQAARLTRRLHMQRMHMNIPSQ